MPVGMQGDDDPFEAIKRMSREYEKSIVPITAALRSLSGSLGIQDVMRALQPLQDVRATIYPLQDLQIAAASDALALSLEPTLARVREMSELMGSLLAPIFPAGFDAAVLEREIGERLATMASEQNEFSVADVVEITDESLQHAASAAPLPAWLLPLLLAIITEILLPTLFHDPRIQLIEKKVDAVEASVELTRAQLEARVRQAVLQNAPITHTTTRDLVLRSKPRSSAERLRAVAKGSGVVVLGVEKQWLRVIHRDACTDGVAVGWLYGRYLRPLSEWTPAGEPETSSPEDTTP